MSAMAAAVDQRQATTTARGRLYEWKGEQFWSVTTLIKGGLRAPAIENWTPTEVAKFAVANHRQLSAMLSTVRMEHIDKRLDRSIADQIRSLFGLKGRVIGPRGGTQEEGDGLYIVTHDPDAISGAVSWLRNAPYRNKERKGEIGTAVHAELEAYALDKPRPEPPLLIRPYIVQFRDFLEVYQPRIVLAEANCYNRTEAYAGRLDAVMEITDATVGTRSWLFDYTTSKDVYAEKGYQAAAYSNAEFVGLPDGSEIPMPKIDGACVLWLSEDAWKLCPVWLPPDPGEVDPVFRDFRLIREAFDIVERRSKKVVGMPVATPTALNFLTVGGAPTLQLVPDQIPVVVESTPEPEE